MFLALAAAAAPGSRIVRLGVALFGVGTFFNALDYVAEAYTAYAAVTGLRRVVEDLRPAGIDDLGLVGALCAVCATLAVPGVVDIDVDASDVGDLPAAVEFAGYRIVCEAVTNANPDIGVLVVTLLDDDAALFAALRAGARGYLLKGSGHADVRHALDTVGRGDTVLTGTVGERLRRGLITPRATRPFPQLADREFEVLQLMCRGRSNEQIANGLVLSLKTIRTNVSAVLTKLGRTRGEAIARGRDAGVGGTAEQPAR